MYERVVAAFDPDDPVGARLIAKRCAQIAADHSSAITLITVRPDLPSRYAGEMPRNWDEKQRSDAMEWLRAKARDTALEQYVTKVLAPAGSVSDNVTKAAREQQADLIVIAAHKMGAARLLLGSNTIAILRDAHCDVLVIRDPKA